MHLHTYVHHGGYTWYWLNVWTWRALLHFLSAYKYLLFVVDFKLLVYHQISKLNLVPSYGTGWGGQHCTLSVVPSYVSGPSAAVGRIDGACIMDTSPHHTALSGVV